MSTVCVVRFPCTQKINPFLTCSVMAINAYLSRLLKSSMVYITCWHGRGFWVDRFGVVWSQFKMDHLALCKHCSRYKWMACRFSPFSSIACCHHPDIRWRCHDLIAWNGYLQSSRKDEILTIVKMITTWGSWIKESVAFEGDAQIIQDFRTCVNESRSPYAHPLKSTCFMPAKLCIAIFIYYRAP